MSDAEGTQPNGELRGIKRSGSYEDRKGRLLFNLLTSGTFLSPARESRPTQARLTHTSDGRRAAQRDESTCLEAPVTRPAGGDGRSVPRPPRVTERSPTCRIITWNRLFFLSFFGRIIDLDVKQSPNRRHPVITACLGLTWT